MNTKRLTKEGNGASALDAAWSCCRLPWRYRQTDPSKWRCYGIGPEFVRVGSRIMYEQGALDAYLDARRRTSTSEAA
jgi:hypothetical protein